MASDNGLLISGGQADDFGARTSIEVFDGESWKTVGDIVRLAYLEKSDCASISLLEGHIFSLRSCSDLGH